MNSNELALAFAFVAAEFLDEEAEYSKEKLGYEHNFWKYGKYIENPDSKHLHEWWARKCDIENYNKLNNNHEEEQIHG